MSEFTKGPLIEKGTIANCEIGGFIAIGREDSPSTAYVAYRNDANLYRAAPDMYEALQAVREWLGDSATRHPERVHVLIRDVLSKALGE